MKVNYKTFSKHAEKIAKGVSEARPILRGIEHREDGTLTVTDTHRLYRAYNVNAPKNVVLDAITGEELTEGSYPNTDKLVPETTDASAVLYASDVKKLKGILKAMLSVGKVEHGTGKNKRIVAFLDGVNLGLDSEMGVKFTFELNGEPLEAPIYFDLQYLLDAVEMFEDMKSTSIRFNLFGQHRPFTITDEYTDDLVALILPIRKG